MPEGLGNPSEKGVIYNLDGLGIHLGDWGGGCELVGSLKAEEPVPAVWKHESYSGWLRTQGD